MSIGIFIYLCDYIIGMDEELLNFFDLEIPIDLFLYLNLR